MTQDGPSIAERAVAVHPPVGVICIVVVLTCVLWLAVPIATHAQREIGARIEHTYTFGNSATFSLVPADGVQISAPTLYLRTQGGQTESYTTTVTSPNITIERDLETVPFPPFSEISYWWTYTSAEGKLIETERHSFSYADNRYAWQTATHAGIGLHWVDGQRSQMLRALGVAEDALARIRDALQAPGPTEVDIYVYPSEEDLASAMKLTGIPWAGAVTYPETAVVLVAIPASQEGLLVMDRDIPHELTHYVLFNLLGAQGYATLPTWLDEGLATHFEGSPDPGYALALERARVDGTLIPLGELCAPFPEDSRRAYLAYAQSQSLVSYLRQQYGYSKIRDLLWAYADGMACSTGVQHALSIDLFQLERTWRRWLDQQSASPSPTSPQGRTQQLLRDTAPWLLVLGALVLPLLISLPLKQR